MRLPRTGRGARTCLSKELTIRIEDKPGTLAECCRALAKRDVNILAFEAFEWEGQSLIRMIVYDPATAKNLLTDDRIYHTETEVAQVALPHRSGELYRAASRLGEAHININYAYCGTVPGLNMSLAVFGVTDVAKAVSLLRGGRGSSIGASSSFQSNLAQ